MRLCTVLASLLSARSRFTRLAGARLEAYQDRLARRLVAYVDRHAPFYHRHFANHDLSDWRTLPTVDKALMMAHFDTFNTRGIRLKDALEVALRAETDRDFRPTLAGLTVGLSSGTSGHRGLFLLSPYEQATWAGVILARTLPGFRRRGYRIAFFLRSNSNLYESLGNSWLRFRYFDLMLPLDEMVAALNEEAPDILVGPPSLLGLLADARVTGRLRCRPERLISVAEVLELQDQERLAAVFDAPVHQIYQCTEGLLAVSCPHGGLHLQEDLMAVQLEPLVEGTAALEMAESDETRMTLIVTDLWRRTQPIIRYRLNDVVTLASGSCPCGSAFRRLARIEGRCDDCCYFERSEGGLRIFFADTIRRMILLCTSAIHDYQAFQDRPGSLRIHLETDPCTPFENLAEAVRRSVQHCMNQYACRPAEIRVEQGLVPPEPGRKRRRVQRLG